MASHAKHKTTPSEASVEQSTESTTPSSPTQTVEQLEEKSRQLQDQLLRALADMENQRRRAAEELNNAYKYAPSKLATDLLGVKDALEMALADSSGQFDTLQMGVSLTHKQLVAAFEKAQISEINPKEGEVLDPHCHHAISAEVSDLPPNAILRVMQKGYVMTDRVLRPAMVIVAKRAEDKASPLEKNQNSHDLHQQD